MYQGFQYKCQHHDQNSTEATLLQHAWEGSVDLVASDTWLNCFVQSYGHSAALLERKCVGLFSCALGEICSSCNFVLQALALSFRKS